MTEEQSDSALVKKIAEGDREAFEILYRRHKKSLFTYLAHYLNDRHAAEDVFQAAFFDAYTRIQEGRYTDTGNFAGWLFVIATHFAKNHIRKLKRIKLTLDEPTADGEGDDAVALIPDKGRGINAEIAGSEEEGIILKAIAELPEKHRQMLLMRAVENLSYKEIAKRLKIHIGLVGMRIQRAKEELYTKLRAKGLDLPSTDEKNPVR